MNRMIATALDFRIVTLAIVGALALAAGQADARPAHGAHPAHAQQPYHGSAVQRSRGADGLVDAVHTRRGGATTSVDRYGLQTCNATADDGCRREVRLTAPAR